MATEKKVAKTAEVKEVKKPAAKKTTKKEVKVSAPEKKATVTKFSKATMHDHEVIIEPIITEKTMSMSQTENKATFKVKNGANKTEIKNAIQRIYGVKVLSVKTVNVIAKATTRGSKFHGTISGFKKAVVRIENGQAIDLFKE
jgi:large subunit ribosomal protein L23